MRRWDDERVCDVCHQVHRQISPACIERRRQREYEESEEGKRALRAMGESFAAAYLACNVAAWRDRERKSR